MQEKKEESKPLDRVVDQPVEGQDKHEQEKREPEPSQPPVHVAHVLANESPKGVPSPQAQTKQDHVNGTIPATDNQPNKPEHDKDDQKPSVLQRRDTHPISNYQRREQSDDNFRQSIAE